MGKKNIKRREHGVTIMCRSQLLLLYTYDII